MEDIGIYHGYVEATPARAAASWMGSWLLRRLQAKERLHRCIIDI